MRKLWRRLAPLGIAALVGLGLTGCGGSAPVHAPPPVHTASTTTVCSGLTDTCQTFPTPATRPVLTLAAGQCRIPDVSNWQGHVNWAAAKPGVCGGIFKGGEALSTDAYASDNNSQLSSLHLWHAFYWYIRNVGCTAEGDAIVREAQALHVKVVINDLESPSENVGYGSCLPALERRAGLTPVNYTSPGTFSSSDGGAGSVPLWQAEYGPTLHAIWRPVVAWQCTDGHYGCVSYVPGIGYGDVSINLGITNLGSAPAPPANPLVKTIYGFSYGIKAGEYGTVAAWRALKCGNPPLRGACETLHYHAQLLRDRLLWEAKYGHPKGWSPYKRSVRLKVLDGIVVNGTASHTRFVAPPASKLAGLQKQGASFGYGIGASEYGTVRDWLGLRCFNPVRRTVCETLHYHAQLLRDRLVWEVHHGSPKGWSAYDRGGRLKILNGIIG